VTITFRVRTDLSERSCWICGSQNRAKDHFCSNCGVQLTHLSQSKTSRAFIGPKDFSTVGIFILVLGTLLSVFGYLIGIVPVMALGLGALILGVMLVFLPEPMSSKAGTLAILCSLPSFLDLEAFLQDLDIAPRGIYIPVAGFGAVPKVLIPMTDSAPSISPPPKLARSNRVFITLGRNTNQRGILLRPPGAEIISALENLLQLDLSTIKLDELSGRMGFAFEMLGISKRTVGVQMEETAVRVQMSLVSLVDLEERLRSEAPRLVEQVGSPLTSAIAGAVSKVTGKYVRLSDSSINGSNLIVTLELLADVSK